MYTVHESAQHTALPLSTFNQTILHNTSIFVLRSQITCCYMHNCTEFLHKDAGLTKLPKLPLSRRGN